MTTSYSLELPESVIACVFFRHQEDGALLAEYVEGRSHVPAPREQVAGALASLAARLLEQAVELDAQEDRR